MVRVYSCCCLLLNLCMSQAGDVHVYPPKVHLRGQKAEQRVIIVEEVNGQAIAECAADYTLKSSNPQVVQIVDNVKLVAVGNGHAQITLQTRNPGKLNLVKSHVAVTVTGAEKETSPSFQMDVIPILTRLGCNTGSCHGALAGKGGLKLSLRGYDPDSDYFVLTRQAASRRSDFAHPEQSLMLLKPLNLVKHGGGRKLEPDSMETELLKRWIANGASFATQEDVTIKSISTYPAAARLATGASLPVIVLANYTNGQTVDVTRRAKFGSSEDQVLKVNEDGQLTVMGQGAAAVTVWYSNLVTTVNVVSAYAGSASSQQRLIANNFIDEEINRRLNELNIPASPATSDREFIRRIYLDCMGILPTSEEVKLFIGDSRPDRRALLIEKLLQRPEYVDYWANKWSDLFLISSKKLPQSNVWAFYQFIRQAVAENTSWNQLARQILTARGSNLENGAANYYVMHKDISDLTETTAITFLGTSITCARCHNHPLDKWTQDQYWSMANLLGRVGHKAGSRASEVIVQPLREGEVLHLRRGVPMPPAPLDGKAMELKSTSDRRAYLANWLTEPGNPFFARAMVNRVWRNFMGRGLVESEDDHRLTNPPSNAALLAALEKDFISHGYDLKHLMKMIMNSASYQRSSVPVAGNELDDRFYSHYLIRRLKAEVILDAYSQVTGVPTPFNQVESGGRDDVTATSDYPLGTRALQLPDTRVVSRFLASFGRPEREQVCACERESDATVAQALHVNNGLSLNEKLRGQGSRIDTMMKEKSTDIEIIQDLYQSALSRQPTAAELAKFSKMLAEDPVKRREALEDLYWGVLSSREFLFNH